MKIRRGGGGGGGGGRGGGGVQIRQGGEQRGQVGGKSKRGRGRRREHLIEKQWKLSYSWVKMVFRGDTSWVVDSF